MLDLLAMYGVSALFSIKCLLIARHFRHQAQWTHYLLF